MTTRKTIAAADRVTANKSRAKKRAINANPDDRPAPGPDAKKHKHKIKVVRDSFTMPENEYARIAAIKEICAKAKMHVKKSEVLRAGLIVLAEMDPAQLRRVLGSLEKIKTGRPKKL
ncbi:MAG: hypothetical protein WCA64_13265 [Gallionella sp.]